MTGSAILHPGLWLAAAGVAAFFLRGRSRSALLLGAPLAALALLWLIPEGRHAPWTVLGFDATLLRVDRLSRLFATIFAVMAFAGALYALGQKSRVEVPAAFVYAGAAIGAVLAGDLVTLFVFWEVMAVGSTLVLWSAGQTAFAASRRYLAMHLFGGMLLMAGIAGQVAATGSIAFETMRPDTLARALILAGFLLNAGAPPLSAWLPDAYPEASWSGMVFLSAFTTKTAVYVLLRGFAGSEILVPIGLFMVFYGIVFAILENDMRRILAYSIVNQVGFMVTGAGIGTDMAVNGAAAHAFTHIIYKGLLLMSAGAVLLQTGKRKCTDLGGLFQSMPLTAACGIVGALSISSFPLTSGFVSKSMISQAAVDGHLQAVWLALAAASAGVFLHAGIKFPWFVFFQKDSGLRPPEPPASLRAAMVLFAFLCLAIGIFPGPLYAMLPYPVDYVPYTAGHVIEMLQLLLFSGLAFFLLLPMLRRTLTITLDTDWTWRRLAPAMWAPVEGTIVVLRRAILGPSRVLAERAAAAVARFGSPSGAFGGNWATRTMMLWVVLLLASLLLLSYR
ncbi:MAG TPA: Na(+)/H(+) antiporter subunit D [Usitatibacteraceae bacterium]|nr:Na(+)/H(+) antiporter subunit D [Usitatibacteraceae bacterium]